MAAALKPVYLLAGSDRPKVERALKRLRARVGENAVQQVSAREASGGDAVAACNTLGLFADGGRLVLVDAVETWKAADVKAIVGYLKDPAPTTVLALAAAEIKRDGPLAKACAVAGELLVYDVSKRALPGWVASQFERLGVSADAAACRLLVELVGDDVVALSSEVEKLGAWAGEERIGEREVEQLVVLTAETPGWAFTDAWGRRDRGSLLNAAEAMLERGGGSRRDEVPRLAGTLTAHVARLRECQVFAEEGIRPREAAGRLRRSPYYVQKLFQQAESFTAVELQNAALRLADLDLALKGGSRTSGELELDRAIIAMTEAPAARGASSADS